MSLREEYEMTDGSGYPKTSPSPEADGNLPVDREQNASTYLKQKLHWGLPRPLEVALFYTLAILAWMSQIAAAVLGSYRHTRSLPFAVTVSVFCVLHWAAWCQTAFAMMQRASWRREETIGERVQFLFFAVRLQRLMLPTAIIAFCTFIQAYARREHFRDIAYWLLFLLFFIIDTVFSVMNAYNNITWEADRLWFDDEVVGVPKVYFAILGI